MVKYVLVGLTTLLVITAIAVMIHGGRQETAIVQGSSPAQLMAIPSPAATTTPRDRAINGARGWASHFGEQNPTLIDAFLTTFSDAQHRLRESDNEPPDGPPPGKGMVPNDGKVWLVRMRGNFYIPRGPGPARDNPQRHPAWMFAIIDAKTGQTVAYGTCGLDCPIR